MPAPRHSPPLNDFRLIAEPGDTARTQRYKRIAALACAHHWVRDPRTDAGPEDFATIVAALGLDDLLTERRTEPAP